jgi:hypothetical protein
MLGDALALRIVSLRSDGAKSRLLDGYPQPSQRGTSIIRGAFALDRAWFTSRLPDKGSPAVM